MSTSIPLKTFDGKLGRLQDVLVVYVVGFLLSLCRRPPSDLDVVVDSVGDVQLRHLPDADRVESETSKRLVLSCSVRDPLVGDQCPHHVAVDVVGPAVPSIASEDAPEWRLLPESSASTPRSAPSLDEVHAVLAAERLHDGEHLIPLNEWKIYVIRRRKPLPEPGHEQLGPVQLSEPVLHHDLVYATL